MQEGEGRFFITKVLRSAINWDEFDADRNFTGAAILWKKENIKRRRAFNEKELSQGTAAKQPTPLETPKRKRQPEKWKVNKRKKAVNSGEEFVYQQKTGGTIVTKTVKKREMKNPCDEKCRMKCQEQFSEDIRQQIFNGFYELGNKDIQSQHLCSLVTEVETTEKKGKDKENSRRSFTRHYHLIKKGEKIKVCQKMFLNTFSIAEKRIRNLLRNKSETGFPLPDGRGKHKHHRREEQRNNCVKQHIMSFQVVESHYVRSNSKFEYLPCELTISDMYSMYRQWAEGKGYLIETYHFYARVFREQFNLKFQKPKKDKCDTCEEFNDKSTPTPEEIVAQENHLKDKELARQIKRAAKESAKNAQGVGGR